MQRKGLILLFVTLFCASINAQLLYEISGKGLKHKSYLFGTHHLVPISSLSKIDGVFKAYNDCDVVVGEVILNESEMMEKITFAAQMNEDIERFYTEEQRVIIDSALMSAMNINLKMMAHWRPAMVQNMYELTMYEKLFPKKDDDGSLDSYFQRMAIYEDKKVYGLESIDEQIDILFKSQSLERQAELLYFSVLESNKINDLYTKINSLYIEGNLNGLYDFANSTDSSSLIGMTEGEKFLLINNRNNNWIDKIINLVSENRCFIAVGALHLPGNEGVINLLKKRGYKVKPVKMKNIK